MRCGALVLAGRAEARIIGRDVAGSMDHILWIALVVTLVAVFCVLVTGVTIFVRGGETNRRYGNFMMNLRVGTQAVAVLILGAIFLLHWLRAPGN
jgi:hypothetical protein